MNTFDIKKRQKKERQKKEREFRKKVILALNESNFYVGNIEGRTFEHRQNINSNRYSERGIALLRRDGAISIFYNPMNPRVLEEQLRLKRVLDSNGFPYSTPISLERTADKAREYGSALIALSGIFIEESKRDAEARR